MQKTAYELRISDLSSDVCTSDLAFICAFGALCGPLGFKLLGSRTRRECHAHTTKSRSARRYAGWLPASAYAGIQRAAACQQVQGWAIQPDLSDRGGQRFVRVAPQTAGCLDRKSVV